MEECKALPVTSTPPSEPSPFFGMGMSNCWLKSQSNSRPSHDYGLAATARRVIGHNFNQATRVQNACS